MLHRTGSRRLAAVAALVLAPAAALAFLPLLAGLGRQIVQNMLIDGVKGQLIGSLAGSGCKGGALAGLIASAGPGQRLPPGMPGGAAGGLTPGGAVDAGPLPAPGSPLGPGRSMRAARGAPEIPTLPPGVDPNRLDMAQMLALAGQQAGGRFPGQPRMTPEQMSEAMTAMSQMQAAMAQPLSREDTLGVFDELGRLGVLSPALQSEAQDCIRLAPPSATQGIGQTGAIFKAMLLPKLREMRGRLADLSPDDQQQLAREIVDALGAATPQDRQDFQQGFGLGFFPQPVVDAVRGQMR